MSSKEPYGLSVEAAQQIVDEFLAHYNGNIPVTPYIRERQEDIYGQAASRENFGFSILGAYHAQRGIFTIAASNLHSEEDARRTIRHELLGHYGLNTFKPAEKRALLDRILETRQEPSLKQIWDRVNADYPTVGDLFKAEEVFAYVAEEERSFFHQGWDKVRATLQKMLRGAGLSSRPLTLAELREEARLIAKGIQEGKRPQQTFPQSDQTQFRVKDKSMEKKPFHETVAAKLIEQLKQGTAPWQKPWKAGEPGSFIPINPSTGKRYRGINALHLMSQGRGDQRWMTFKQAAALGAQVIKGETGTPIQYWKFTQQQTKTDDNGKPVLGANGEAIKEELRLERPKVFFATVFNAEQIDGLPVVEIKAQSWDPLERAENILSAAGATITHNDLGRAYYTPTLDRISLPNKSLFPKASGYYATALHELGHWTGHESRLNRDLAHPFGSEGYAKEELRAEIASMILGDEIGIGHDPAQHAAYVSSWIKALQEDPLEIFRAAADAEKIQEFVLLLELKPTQEQTEEIIMAQDHNLADDGKDVVDAKQNDENRVPGNIATEKIWLAIPYEQKEAAKQVAGRLPDGSKAIDWDKSVRCWYAHPGADLDKIKPWISDPSATMQQASALTPREEFAEALRALGCQVTGDHPVMDGNKHRIGVEGDQKGEQAGFYVGHLDGHPAGYVKNNRSGIEMKWKSKGYSLDADQKANLAANAAAKLQARAAEQEALHERTAQRVRKQLDELVAAQNPTPYMEAKGIVPQPGVYTDREGKTMYIPVIDTAGKQWSMQYIQEDGIKRFAKDSRKEGCFHVIGGLDAIARAPVIIIAEGYATASSLAETLGFASVVAFDAGNLGAVAKAMRAKFPDTPIIIAGDNDQHLATNPGKKKAEEAARAVDGIAMFPIFAPSELNATSKSFKDFNDLATKSVLGRDGLERQVRVIVEQAIEKRSIAAEHKQKQALPARELKAMRR